jgi:hypothetical protein
MPLADTVKFINELLRANKIDHFYIGGVAYSAYGEPRATKDADIVVVVPMENSEALLDLIEDAGLHVWNRRMVLQKPKAGKTAKINWDRKFSFDLRCARLTLDEHALNRAIETHLTQFGQTLNLATAEDIIVYKLARFDDQDRIDIRSIIQVQDRLDWKYIDSRTPELATETNRPELAPRLEEIKGWVK